LIRKKTAAARSARVYVTPNTKEEGALLDVLHLYGMARIVDCDEQGMYIDLTPPAHWTASRKGKFKKAIAHARGE
jgi:hypothetical protein